MDHHKIWRVGDLAVLLSGSPLMTVVQINEHEGIGKVATCIWVTKAGMAQSILVNLGCLLPAGK